MSEQIKAFPRPFSTTQGGVHEHQAHFNEQDGMTLRDYFAAKAMPLFIDLVPTEVWNQGQGMEGKVDNALMAAKAAYRMADAMLKAREA